MDKVYVVKTMNRCEYEDNGEAFAYRTKASAKKKLASLYRYAKSCYKGYYDEDDIVYEKGEWEFSIYVEGYYDQNSMSAAIYELKVNE